MNDSRLTKFRLALLYAAYFGSIAVIFPYMPIYLRLRGFNPARIGLILSAIEAAAVISPFLLSRLADRSGRYRTAMSAMLVTAIAALYLLDISEAFPVVLLFAFLNGLVYKPISGMADALSGRALVDSSANHGKVRLWGTISFIALSMVLQVTGRMDSDDPGLYMKSFFMALAVLLVSIPFTAAAPSDDGVEIGKAPGGLRGMPPGYYSLLALSLVGNVGFAIHQAFGSLYYSEVLGIGAVSSLFALAAFTEIPSLFFSGRILGYLGHRRMLFIALSAGVLRLTVLALFSSSVPIYLSQLTHTFVFGFFYIAGVNWVNRTIHPRRRALGMGLFIAAGFSGAQLAGSALGGYLLEWGGFPLLFGIGACFPLTGMAWMLIDRRIGRVSGDAKP